jgi:glycosyltransferase involved in cell wall biosynthesis
VSSRVLVVTEEPLRARLAGPAVRSLELARAVAGVAEVDLVSLTACERTDDAVRLGHADAPALRRLVAAAGAVVLQGDVLGLQPWLAATDVPIVVDAYDPFHLEQLEQARGLGEARRRAVVRDAVRSLNRQLGRADLVLAASGRQRDLWLGHLAALGRVNPVTYDDDPELRRLLAVVPFGVPAGHPAPAAVLPPGIEPGDRLLLWGGGLYDWFDPVTLVRAVAALVPAHPRVRLLFLGTRHPGAGSVSGATELATRRVADELGVGGRQVLFADGWVPYDERAGWLAAAEIGVTTHLPHLETEFSFRTRVLDYLWAGLPVVTTAGDVMAELVAAEGLGAVVPPRDPAALATALDGLLSDPVRRSAAAAASARVAERYRWPLVAAPLLDFCREPRRAPDLVLPAADRALLGIGGLDGTGPRLRTRLAAARREGGLRLVARRAAARLRPSARPDAG